MHMGSARAPATRLTRNSWGSRQVLLSLFPRLYFWVVGTKPKTWSGQGQFLQQPHGETLNFPRSVMFVCMYLHAQTRTARMRIAGETRVADENPQSQTRDDSRLSTQQSEETPRAHGWRGASDGWQFAAHEDALPMTRKRPKAPRRGCGEGI